MRGDAPNSDERVLSTLNVDGSRRWLKPWLSRGRFLSRRRVVAYALILIFTVIPHLRIGGKPGVLLDITAREFTFFGTTFYPSDTLLLALLVVSVFLTVFLATALLGRIWCGWACPQTVYMEFVYRPLERLFDGSPGRKRKTGAWRTPAKYTAFLLVSAFLAHTFLSYFVGTDALREWMTRSPLEHPTGFLVVLFVTAMMMFDFSFFREQTCIVACPYGRMQSVMLDRQSLIVSYDRRRGEPRGRKKRAKKTDGSSDVGLKVIAVEGAEGDCIDCHKCVTTCPTGIDIRDGLQLECIGCAQCIDACDDVMGKIGKPRGLIRYTSQAAVEGDRVGLIRARTVQYPLILMLVLGAFVGLLATKSSTDVTFLTDVGAPYYVVDGEVVNRLRLRVHNRGEDAREYTVSVAAADGTDLGWPVRIESERNPMAVEGRGRATGSFQVVAPMSAFRDARSAWVVFTIVDDTGEFEVNRRWRIRGPM